MDLILLIFPNTTGVEDASAVSRVITGYLASDIQSLALLQLPCAEVLRTCKTKKEGMVNERL